MEQKNFDEIERITKILRDLESEPKRTDRQAPTDNLALKSTIKKLEKRIADLSAPDPIVGVWKYFNGNVIEISADGRVEMSGNMIAIWRRMSNGTYVMAFHHPYAGVSDELTLQQDGKKMIGKGKSQKPFDIFRLSKP